MASRRGHDRKSPDIPGAVGGMGEDFYRRLKEEMEKADQDLPKKQGASFYKDDNIDSGISDSREMDIETNVLATKGGKTIQYRKTKVLNTLRDGKELPKKLNILVVGKQGVGKSSFVNSLLMAINKRGYQQLAFKGGYGLGGQAGRGAVTLSIEQTHLFSMFEKGAAELGYNCQPYVYDIPGFEDVDDENITILLRMVINGKMKDGANMSALLKQSHKDLKRQRSIKNKDREIHVVFVVHAAIDTLPENLLTVINDATRPDKPGKRCVPVFGVVSKLDQLPKKDYLPRIVTSFSEGIGAAGAEEKIFPTNLYCHDVTPGYERNETIDSVMLSIWETILKSDVVKESSGWKFFSK